MDSSFRRFLLVDHTRRRTTVGRTPLDEWLAGHRCLYLTIHYTKNRQPCPRWDSNPQSQQASGRRPTPENARSLGPTDVTFTCPHFFFPWRYNTHNRQISMPRVGFEPTISAGERPKTYALDRVATGTGTCPHYMRIVVVIIMFTFN